jgi:replicative DNA helicase
MELEKTLSEINKNRERAEAPFVMCLWKDPILYDDYKKINEDGDQSIITEDAKFYFELGRAMYKEGYRNFDEMTVSTFLTDKPAVKERFESYGGFREVEQLKALCDTNNIDAYYEGVARLNILSNICSSFFKQFENMDKFKNMTSQNIFDLFEYQLSNSSLSIEQDVKIEDLSITDDFIKQCDSGDEMGLDYSENCPILCGKTMGLPIGDVYLLGGYSGVGKSSFIFENMILALSKQGISTAVISNEMTIDAYQKLLLVHILVNDLNYWDLTRKKIKSGHFTNEQKEMIKKAQKIQKEKYNNIKFVKLYDSDINKVLKIGKRLSRQNVKMICYDTMKGSDDAVGEGSLWQQILLDSRRLFQLASKEQISIVMAYQLAIHTENVRYTSSSCLSNAKQIKEVMSEQVFLRKLWDDERDKDSKFYCKPYRLKRVGNTYQPNPIELDSERKYLVAFLDKTRNDEDGLQFLYEWNARFNKWVEVGQCKIVNSHERY